MYSKVRYDRLSGREIWYWAQQGFVDTVVCTSSHQQVKNGVWCSALSQQCLVLGTEFVFWQHLCCWEQKSCPEKEVFSLFGELAASMRPRISSMTSLLLQYSFSLLLLTMLLHMFYEVSKEWPTKTRITSYDKTEKWFLWPTTTCVVLSAISFHAQSLSNQMVLFKSNIQPLVCIYK